MPPVNDGKQRAGRRELAALWTAEIDDFATCLAWSADAALCAVGSASGKVWLLDGRTGAVLRTLEAHPGGVMDVDFCPSKRLLATGGQDGTARIFRGEDGALLATLPGTREWVERVAWCPDGKKVATSSGRVARLWTADGAPMLETEPHPSTVAALAWSRKGAELATASYGGVHLWRVGKRARARHLAWRGSLLSLAWSPDDRVLAAGSQDCSVHFWRLPSGRDSAMEGYSFKPKALAWSADSSLLATGGEATVTVWDFMGRGPEGTAPVLLAGHMGVVTALAFSHKGTRLASGAQDTGVILWDPRRGMKMIGYAFLRDHVSRLAFRPHHDALAAADASGNVACWALTG